MKAKTKITRLLSILLTFAMVVGMLPTVAPAAEESATAPSEVHNSHSDFTTLPYASSEWDELQSTMYYLDEDISLSNYTWYWTKGNTTVCLNGHIRI